MPLDTATAVNSEALGRAKPTAARAGAQYYELEDANGRRVWVRGAELLAMPAPVKVTAIAWRV